MKYIDKNNIKKNTIKIKSLLILLVFSVSVFLTACDQLDIVKDVVMILQLSRVLRLSILAVIM